MDSAPLLGFKQLFAHIIGDMAKALCERPNESKEQRFVRVQAVTQMIMGLLPRDVIEAMLAGQVVMFHDLLTDSIHDTLQGQIDTMRRATRVNIVALNRAFHMNFEKLAHYQLRPSQGTREATAERPSRSAPAAAPETTPNEARPNPGQTTPPLPPTSSPGGMPTQFQPSPEQIAACRANPEVMAALEAGDAERFVRAMGVENPSAAYLEAAAGLPTKVPVHVNRSMRRHPR